MSDARSDNDARPDAAISVEDRRRAPRVTHRAAFDLVPLDRTSASGAANVTVVLQDLSATGIGVIHSEPLRVGDRFRVPLVREGARAEGLALICTVVRCEQMDDDLYSIGFRFNSSAEAVDEGSRQLTGQAPPRD